MAVADEGALRVVQREVDAVRGEAVGGALAADDVHRRRADELGHEARRRAAVDVVGRAELLDHAALHHRDVVAQRHRLDLVVRDVDRRHLRLVVQVLDLGAHLDAQLGVEVGERLVEQEQRRVARQRAAHRDALALAAGELAGLAIQQVLDLQHLRDARDRRVALGLGHVAHLQPEADVLRHVHVRVERVALEHHRDVAVLGQRVRDVAAVDVHRALGGFVQPGDDVQERALAAARGADEDEKVAGHDLDVDALENVHVAVAAADVADRECAHVQPFTAPAVRPRTKYLPATM